MKNKILFFNLNGRGGMLHYASRFVNELSLRSEYDVSVVMPSYSRRDFYSSSVKIVALVADPNPVSFIWQTFLLSNWIKMFRSIYSSEIIHFMDNHPWMILLFFYCRLFDKKIYVTLHDPIPHSGESNIFFVFLYRLINRLARLMAHRIFIHSELFLPMFSKKEKNKVVVIPHGTYDQFGVADFSGKDPKAILFFGRILEYKGLDILLAAWKNIDDKEAKLIIAGEGDLSPYHDYLVGKQNIEIYNQYIDESEVPGLFSRASLLVLPYKDATQSGPLMLAYNYGVPVLASRVGSLVNYVQHNVTGWLVPPNDSAELTRYLNKALGNPLEIYQMGRNALKVCQTKYSWKDIVRKVYP